MTDPFLVRIAEYLDGRGDLDLFVITVVALEAKLAKFHSLDKTDQEKLLSELRIVTHGLPQSDLSPSNPFLFSKRQELIKLTKDLEQISLIKL